MSIIKMNTTFIKSAIFSLGILGVSIYQINGNSSGASSPKTGAPNENSCNSCHSGSSLVTSGTQHARIQLKGSFTGSGYIPDSTYTLTLTYAETGKSTFGFQMTALANGKAAGTFTASTRTGTFSSSVNGATRYYVEHNSTGSSGIAKDSTAWTFQWKAPSNNVGNITFYAALNSTNGNGSSSGDVVYNKTFSISPSTLLPEATASLKSTLTCAGTTLEFEGKGTNNSTSYSWAFPTGTPASSNLQNPKINFANAGTHLAILTVKNNKGSSLIDTLKFNVLDAAIKPNLNIRTATTVLCLGDTLNFNIGSTQKHTYTWNNGATGRNNQVTTGGFVGVTALRDNGCSVKSDSVFVIGVPKPKFTVSYGLLTDSICVNETLLVLLKNQGVADSYSRVSNQGPFFKDSFLTYSISKGNNSFQFWAKNTLGCVSNPSKTKIFHGIDTPSAPLLNISSRLSDKILFNWDPVQHAELYEYSINNGTTWSKVDSLQTRKQWILLDSATQLVDFWIRAKTGNFCTYSHIGKIQARGAGCTEPNWSVSASNLTTCFDSLVELKINGLGQLSKYSLMINQESLKDSVYRTTIRTDRDFTLKLLDSQQLLCGSFEKSISIKVENPEKPKNSYFPQQEILFCDAVFGGTEIPLIITNYKKANKYHLINGANRTSLDSVNLINTFVGNYIWRITSTTPNGCVSLEDTLYMYSDHDVNTNFDFRWLSDLTYEFAAIYQDTTDYEHTWIDSASGKLLSTGNKATITVDYSAVGNVDVTITHQMRSKRYIDVFGDNNCRFELNKPIQIRNLSNHSTAVNNDPVFFPNPLNSLSELLCNGCEASDNIEIWSIDGKQIGTFTLQALQNQTVSNGIYLIRISNRPNASMQKLILGE